MFDCVLIYSLSSPVALDIIRLLYLSIRAISAASTFIHHAIELSPRFHAASHCIFISSILRRCIIPTFGLFSIGRC